MVPWRGVPRKGDPTGATTLPAPPAPGNEREDARGKGESTIPPALVLLTRSLTFTPPLLSLDLALHPGRGTGLVTLRAARVPRLAPLVPPHLPCPALLPGGGIPTPLPDLDPGVGPVPALPTDGHGAEAVVHTAPLSDQATGLNLERTARR